MSETSVRDFWIGGVAIPVTGPASRESPVIVVRRASALRAVRRQLFLTHHLRRQVNARNQRSCCDEGLARRDSRL